MLSSNHLAKCHILMIIEINETTAEQLQSLWHILLRHNYVHYLGRARYCNLRADCILFLVPLARYQYIYHLDLMYVVL